MSGKPKYDYPEDEELKKLCLEHGYIKLAVMLGIPASTLQNHLRRRGIEGKKKAKAVEADPTKLPEEVSETEMLQQRVRELESQVRKDRKGRVYDERVTQAVEQSIQKAKPSYSPQVVPKSKKKGTQHEFVLDWSDLHAGEVVSLEETGGMNEYNWEIMMERHDKLRRALFSFQDPPGYPARVSTRIRRMVIRSGMVSDSYPFTDCPAPSTVSSRA